MQKKWGKTAAVLLAFVIAGTVYCVETCTKEPPEWESMSGAVEKAETEGENSLATVEEAAMQMTETVTTETMIYVHICGAVSNPGVYEIAEGSRLYELLSLAGGVSEEGCADALNLAELLRDGQRIVIPTFEEAETIQDMVEQTAQGRVNINTASAEELMTLPGIGEAKAADIIQYRETQGKFQTTEDIMKISGIKDALFQKIKDRITV